MSKIINVIEKAVDYIQIVFLCSIVAGIGAQIFSRKIFDKPLEFPEESSMFMLIAVVILGIVIVEKENSHIKVEYFFERMSHKGKKIVLLSGKILTFIIVLAILNGERQLFPRIFHLKTTAAGIPYLWIHTIIAISCILWLLVIAYTVLQTIRGERN